MNKNNSKKNKIRILLISSYQIIQESLRILIEDNPDMMVAKSISPEESLPATKELSAFDSVLIYLKDEDKQSIEIISQLLESNPNLRIVVVTSCDDFDNQTRALQLGAVGIVKKEQNTKMLIEAIRQTYRGETWINQVLLAKLLNNNNRKKDVSKNWNALTTESFTKREEEVIVMICKGLKNKEIAKRMFISEATVRHHLSSVYGKFGVEDRLNLVIQVFQSGLIKTIGADISK